MREVIEISLKTSKRDVERNIRHFRKRHNMTQHELARQCGYERTYIGKMENGSKTPSLEAVERIADALDVGVAAMFDRRLYTDEPDSNCKTEHDSVNSVPEKITRHFNYLIGALDSTGLVYRLSQFPWHPQGLSKSYCYGKLFWEIDQINLSDSVKNSIRKVLDGIFPQDSIKGELVGTTDDSSSVRSDVAFFTNQSEESNTDLIFQMFWPQNISEQELDDLEVIEFQSLKFR